MDSILYLVRIFFHVVQLVGIAQVQNQLVSAIRHAPHHLQATETVMIHFIAGKFRVHIVVDTDARIMDLRHHTPALQQTWDGQAHVFHHRGYNVNV